MRITTCVLMFALVGVAVPAQNPKPVIRMTADQFSQITTDYNALQKDVQQLQAQQQKIQLLLQELQSHDAGIKALTAKLRTWETRVDSAAGNSQAQLLEATKRMQEMSMSFNMQYLQLQQQMQHENRTFTALSNIMKTKHDTAKNSISNVR